MLQNHSSKSKKTKTKKHFRPPRVLLATFVVIGSLIYLFPSSGSIIGSSAASAYPPTCYAYYTVQPGETLWGIAFRHNTSLQAIVDANPGVIPTSLQSGRNYLPMGMVLNIPSSCNSKPYSVIICGNTYIVQQGETLWGVALMHNTSPQAIIQANPGIIPVWLQTGPNYLPAGMALSIPAACFRPFSASSPSVIGDWT
jgi:LysM repeat protein